MNELVDGRREGKKEMVAGAMFCRHDTVQLVNFDLANPHHLFYFYFFPLMGRLLHDLHELCWQRPILAQAPVEKWGEQ